MKMSARGFILLIALVPAAGLVACASGGDAGAQEPAPSGGSGGQAEYQRAEVLAPIEKVEVLIRESWPPQYAVDVTSGLPSGCAKFERITHSISGDRIEVEVINTEPAPGELVACTAIYGYSENTVELGTDFEAGKTFTVSVNGVEETFVGQGGPDIEPPTVEVLAPIEKVEVLIRESWPPQYLIQVTSGLPNGCAEFESISHAIHGDRIEVDVINTEPGPGVLAKCSAIYGYETNDVIITDVLDAGATYTVVVNGTEEATFEGQGGPGDAVPAWKIEDGYETVEVAAPIEKVEVLIRESFPVQYAVQVLSGLPGGCAEFERITHSISGDRIEIEVINTEPAPGELVACTMIYGYSENTVELGTDFETGKAYTVQVNEAETTFVAQ